MPDKPIDFEAWVAEAQAREAPPSAAFLDAALAQAYAALPMPVAVAALPRQRPFWSELGSLFGGWQGLSALAASALAGLWVGYGDWQGITSAGLSGIAPSFASQLGELQTFDSIDTLIAEG